MRRFRIERDADGMPALLAAPNRLTRERDSARANASVLAHAWRHDSRPPDEVVREVEGYPVENKDAARDGM